MSIPAQTWIHEHTSTNMGTWAYKPKHEYLSIPPKHEYMSIPAQTWVHEIVGNSKDVSILYEITGDWWQRYYMILHRIQLYWLHEHTSTNKGTWAYQPKHEYMSIPAQTLLHEHTSSNMSTWAYQPKHYYMSIPTQTWLHEHTSPKLSTWAYQPKHEYMSISAHNRKYEHISP